MFAKKLTIIIGLTAFGTPAFADVDLSRYAKVYRGDEGVRVTVIPVSPKNRKQALIEVSGIDTEIDGKVFLYDEQNQGRAVAYVMQYDGETRTRLRIENGYWSKWVTLYLPDVRDGYKVWYDEKESKKVAVGSFAKRYGRHKVIQEQLAKFNRRKNQDYNVDKFNELKSEAKKDCGVDIAATIDWGSITDETLMKYSVYSYCGRPLEELARFCRKDLDNKKKVQATVENVRCTWGKKLKARMDGKTFDWTTDSDTGNQDDFVAAFIRNQMQ